MTSCSCRFQGSSKKNLREVREMSSLFLRFKENLRDGLEMPSLFLPFPRFLQGESKRGIGHVFFVTAKFKVPPKRI
jgi:hypothetical protein